MATDNRKKLIKKKKKIIIDLGERPTIKSKHQKFDAKAKSYVEDLFGITPGGTLDVSTLPEDFDASTLIDAENEFDLVNLVEKSIDPHTGVPRNIKIPEGDFKEAKNFFDYCSNFRGSDSKFPFARQMWFMSMLFAEVCPRCTPKKMFNIMNIPVDMESRELDGRLKFFKYGICPKCKGHKSEFIKNGELNQYTELSLCMGQRSGKSTTTGAGAEYLTHKYLMYPKMSSVCRGISASTPLSATFVGYRFSDAMSLLWDPIIKGIESSSWFISFHEMLDHYGQLHGVEFYRKKDIYLRYGYKNLELYPSGPTKRGLRGRTRWLSGIDELGWFPVGETSNQDDERERADANGTYDALDRSLLTMRGEISHLYSKGHDRFLQAYAINVSSPSHQGDKITRLVEENKDSKTSLALRLPTWEVTPFFPRDNPFIVDAYRKNPIEAERDYGANPPLNASVFIQQSAAVRAFIDKNRATVSEHSRRINDQMRQTGKIETSSPPSPCPPCLLSMDAGLVNNSFSITVLYLNQVTLGGVSTVTINVPVLLEVMPKKGHMLHYPMIYKHVIKPLIKDFNVHYMFADRWNSISLLDTAQEDFTSVPLVAKQYSVKYVDFITTRSYLEEGKMILPALEMDQDLIRRVDQYPEYFIGKPAAHLLFQMITVRDRGKTVIKGEGYTDDTFRALVLGTSRILDEKIRTNLLEIGSRVTKPFVTGAMVVGRSQMGIANGSAKYSHVAGQSQGQLLLGGNGSLHQGNVHIVRTGRN